MTSLLAEGARSLAPLAFSLFFALQGGGSAGDAPKTFVPAPILDLASAAAHLDLPSAAARLEHCALVRPLTSLAASFVQRSILAHLPAFVPETAFAGVNESAAAPAVQTEPKQRQKRRKGSRSGAGPESETKAAVAAGEHDATAEENTTGDDSALETEPSRPRPMRRSNSQSVILGDDQIVVPEDEYHGRDIVCIGGRVTVRGEVRGQIVVVGGVLHLSGTVTQDVVGVASRIYLEDGARVEGCVTNVAGSVERARDIKIRGDFTSIGFPDLGRFATGRGFLRFLLVLIFWIAIFSTAIQFLAVLVVAAIAPGRIEGALAEPRRSWVLAFFLGAVVWVISMFLTLILCILLPLGVAFWIAFHVVLWMGRAAIYLHVGRGIGRTLFGKELSYFGSILTGFALFAIIGLVPCFGMVLGWMVSVTGLGLMLLTRFGGSRPGPVIPVVPVPSRPVPPPPPLTT